MGRGAAALQLRSASGFTMMELVVVFGIVSVLATLAIPRFLSYRASAAQTEAKLNLSMLFKTESSHLAEYGDFTDDLRLLNWQAEGSPSYVYGFTSDGMPGPSGVNDSAEWCGIGCGFPNTNMVDAFGTPLSVADLPAAAVTRGGFTIGAVGNLDNDPGLDRWTLNDAGALTHIEHDN